MSPSEDFDDIAYESAISQLKAEFELLDVE